jgi:WD repeat-containing protein 48
VFYSGDRAGLLCRTDVEGATDVSGGECVLLAREPGEAHLAASEGITRIAAADDHLVWTATSSSSIRRWAVPPRRAVRAWAHTTSPGADSPPMPQTPPRNGSVAHRRSFVPSIVGSTVDAASVGGRAGLPYASLVRLVSANDPFAPAYPRARGDADVATLYSAASVMSVPRQTRTPLSPGFTLPAGPFSGVGDPEAEDDGRAAWEEREVAADAAPLCAGPLDVLVGEVGLVRSVMLNDRLHALTVDTHGVVAILDVVRGAYKGMFTREDVIAATRGPAGSSASSAAGSDGSDRDRDRSPREALETVRERIEGEAVVQTWCTLDTKTGVLAVHMGERCFEAEIYADEAGYPNERFNDEQRRTSSLFISNFALANI